MQALDFWKIVTMDTTNFISSLIDLLERHAIRYCVIGGQGVNAYVEPLVSLDLDLAVAVEQVEQLEALLPEAYQVRRFLHSLKISLPGSDLRVQIQTDRRYSEFVQRAAPGPGPNPACGRATGSFARKTVGCPGG